MRLKLKTIIRGAKLIISTRKLVTKTQAEKELKFVSKINGLFDGAKNHSVNLPAAHNTQNLSAELTGIAAEDLSNSESNDSDTDGYESVGSNYEDSLEFNNSDESQGSDQDESTPKKRKISNEMLKKIDMECGPNASYRVISTFIKIGIGITGSDPKGYSVSKSQLCRQLSQYRSSEKEKTYQNIANSNSKLVLHFDTKSFSKLNKRHLGSKLRIVVILRSETTKVTLGPYIIASHGAEVCANAIIDIITKHHLRERIIGMVCDTEGTNTGQTSGVCLRIEQFVQRSLLYLMCRHHSHDLILKHVGEKLFGDSTAPTFNFESLNLKRSWENLNLEQFLPYVPENVNEARMLADFQADATNTLISQAEKRQTRDDYAELTDLALKFLGKSDITKKSFMVPGTISNARWMAKGQYVLKAFLLRHQLTIEEDSLDKLRRFALFISLIYAKYWNYCTSIFDAPVNDLHMLQELEKYRIIDEEVANTALKAYSRHLWYLSDELVVLSLFSDHLVHDEKEMMRRKLTPVVGERTTNSIKHNVNVESFSVLHLSDFVTDRSMFLFSALHLDASFLEHEAKDWGQCVSYRNNKCLLKKWLVAVNDSAERALGQTAIAINNQKARTEETLQNLLLSKFNK